MPPTPPRNGAGRGYQLPKKQRDDRACRAVEHAAADRGGFAGKADHRAIDVRGRRPRSCRMTMALRRATLVCAIWPIAKRPDERSTPQSLANILAASLPITTNQ